MNRADLQALSRLRRREARALLRSGLAAGSYYLTGYAVECALKACIAAETKRFDFPDKRRAVDSYTHDLSVLLRMAGLQLKLDEAVKTNHVLDRNWAVVKDWKETSRYDRTIGMNKARALYKSATARRNGVLAWLRPHW
jgi:HEPN domain-containing protein